MANELKVDAYVSAFLGHNVSQVIEMAENDMDAGMIAQDIVSKAMIPAMTVVGQKFQNGEIYIPEMMVAAKTMSEAIAHFKDQLTDQENRQLGSVIIGTVNGDLHDIGKNLVVMMLEGQGFSVDDLGVSVSTEKFVKSVKEKKPDILAMSALLTTTLSEMKTVIEALKHAGLRDTVRVIVGGAPVTKDFAGQIGADGYADDSPGAAQKCKELISGQI